MSHVSRVKTKLKNIDKNLLKRTSEIVSKELNVKAKYLPNATTKRGRYVTIESEYGILLINNEPIGFVKVGDSIEIRADTYVLSENIINKIVDIYIAVAIAEVASVLGYQVTEYSTSQSSVNMVIMR